MYVTTPSVGASGPFSPNLDHDRYQAPPDRSINVERLEQQARIREILGAHLRLGAHVRVRQGRPDAQAESVPRPLLDDEGLVWSAPFALPATVEVEAYNAIYRFTVDKLAGPDGLRSPVPSTLLHLRQRWLRRMELLPGDPLSSGELPLHDISYGGFSFVFDGRQEHFEPGEKLPDLCLDGEIHMGGVVRSVAGGASERALCRVEATARSAADEALWRALVDSRMHPQTRLGGGAWSSELWSLYGACGYFGLSGKEPAQFNALKEAFVDVTRRLEGAREIGYHVVFPSRSAGAMAALSMLKVYSRSWLGFQMAKRKGDAPEGMTGRSILREIHLRAYEQAQSDGDLDWLIGYIQVKPVWSRLVHHDLPQRYVERGDASMTRFQAIEIASSGDAAADPAVLPATSAEVETLCATLAKSRPRAYIEGLDLTPARLDLAANVALWHSAGMARERTTLIAHEDGVAVAAAVVELGQDGAHLFRLLDLVRLYPLRSDAAAHYPRLLEATGRWFAARGKPSFVLFREEGTEVDLAQVPVLKDMGFADMSILSAALLPELLEHVCEVTAPPN